MVKLIVDPLFGSGLAALAFLLLLAGVLFLFPIKRGDFPPLRRRVLLGLRLALFALFALPLFRPAAVFHKTSPLSATLLLLADTSESMSVRDQAEDSSRYDEMRRALDSASDALLRLEENGSVGGYRFDADAAPLAMEKGRLLLPSEPTGRQTAIGDALASVLARESGKRILGAILLSDGAQRTRPPYGRPAQDAAFLFRDAAIPIWTLCCGNSGPLDARRDVAVREMTAPDRVFAENTMAVTGLLRAVGCSGRTIRLSLKMENDQGTMESVAAEEFPVESDEAAIPYRFEYAPKAPGQWKVTVEAETLDGELLTRNNAKSDFVEVIEGGFSLLCLEGTPRFEQKFIRMALESSAEIRVDYGRIAPDRTVLLEGKSEAERIAAAVPSRKSFVEPFFAPGRYAGYLLGDIDASAFKSEELAALADRVREGAGLIFTAGDRAFSAGGYAETPLADLFPVRLDERLRIPLAVSREEFERAVPSAARARRVESVQMLPTESGAGHFLTQLSVDPAKSLERWKALPPLATIWSAGEPKPGADVLAVSGGSPSVPLLITQLYGSGRVALLATDSTWRWSLGGFGDEQRRFWRQLALWTANRDQLREGELVVAMDNRRFAESDPVEFRVLYRPREDETGEELLLSSETVTPDGERIANTLTADTSADGASWLGTFARTGTEGDYRIAATVRSKRTGAVLAESAGRFLVESFNPELDNPAASPATLTTIAQISGGGPITPEELPGLIDRLAQKKENLVETREIRRTLYDTWPLFLGMIALLSAEWFLRRRWGLI